MRHSKVTQEDLNRLPSALLFSQETENDSGQRKTKKIGYIPLRTDPTTATAAEAIYETNADCERIQR